jgi:hypothetical protein
MEYKPKVTRICKRVFKNEPHPQNKSKSIPFQIKYVAYLSLADGSNFFFERTTTSSPTLVALSAVTVSGSALRG